MPVYTPPTPDPACLVPRPAALWRVGIQGPLTKAGGGTADLHGRRHGLLGALGKQGGAASRPRTLPPPDGSRPQPTVLLLHRWASELPSPSRCAEGVSGGLAGS